MANQVLVNKLHSYISKQSKSNKHFNLAMLLDDDPAKIDSHYSLVFSSKWLDNKSPKQAVSEIMQDIIAEIGVTSNEYKMISRVSIIKTADPFVNMLTSAYSVCSSTVNITNCNINGVVIEKGTLLEAHNPNFDILPMGKKLKLETKEKVSAKMKNKV